LVDGLKTSVNDLSMMISNLLNFSMLVSQNMHIDSEEFYLRDFFHGLQKIIQIKTDKAKIKLVSKIDEQLPDKTVADSRKIAHMIYNLTDHAVKYTPIGGKVSFQADGQAVGGQYMLRIKIFYNAKSLSVGQLKELTEENKALITLKKDVTESDRDKIGLAIVSKLCKVLGGSFEIGHKNNETHFNLEIPVKDVGVRKTNSMAPNSPLKILLVEDHFMNQIATKKVLTSWSPLVTVDIAENGMIGVEKFKAHGYDIVLMDIQMPVMNGWDASIRIREKSDVPIIALTASSNKAEADRCIELGINDYLPKPFNPQELHSKIMGCIMNRR